MDSMFSVSEQTRGSSVLLTGSLGFLGSVCLEQLLRLTEVGSLFTYVFDK
jgi:thioester reductase-like protein